MSLWNNVKVGDPDPTTGHVDEPACSAIWDGTTRSYMCSRQPHGDKPPHVDGDGEKVQAVAWWKE